MRLNELLVMALVCNFLIGSSPISATMISGGEKVKSTDQLNQEIARAEAAGINNKTWSPSLKKSYNESLISLYQSFNSAIDNEIDQLDTLLKQIPDESARKPLLNRLDELRKTRDVVTAKIRLKQSQNNQLSEGEDEGDNDTSNDPSVEIGNGHNTNHDGNDAKGGATQDNAAGSPDVVAQRKIDDKNGRSTQKTGTVKGSVASADGTAASGAAITLEGKQDTTTTAAGVTRTTTSVPTIKATSQSDGTFLVTDVPAGIYSLSIKSSDGKSSYSQDSFEVNVKGISSIKVSLSAAAEPSVSIRAIIKGGSGTGVISNAEVHLLIANTSTSTPAFVPVPMQKCRPASGKEPMPNDCYTDPMGIATITDLDSSATYKIAVTKYGYRPYVLQAGFTVKTMDVRSGFVAEMVPESGDFYRGIVGFEEVGASSTTSQENLFLNFYFSHPILRGLFDPFNNVDTNTPTHVGRLRVWGDFRLTSLPDQSQNIFQSFDGTLSNGVTTAVGKLTNQSLAISLLGGLQYKFLSGGMGGRQFDFSTILAGGFVTPFSPASQAQLFSIPDATKDPIGNAALITRLQQIVPSFSSTTLNGKTDIAFVTPDRSRFYKQYFTGIRMETFYNGDVIYRRDPATFDFTIGQSELVTGGELRGLVTRIDGFFPLPIKGAEMVYLFGTAQLRVSTRGVRNPLILPTATPNATVTSPTTLIFTVPAADRDLYRIGVGVNLFGLFSKGSQTKP